MNMIKKQIIAALWTGLLALTVRGMTAPPDFTKAIKYTPPTNFYGGPAGEARTDPGDNPFSMNGPRVLEYLDKNDRCGCIIFQLGLVGAYVGEGKVVKFLPVASSALKEEIESEYKGKFPNSTPAIVGEINGLTSVSLTATRPPGEIRPYFLYFCWIQIETNIALKVAAYACNAESIQAMTNSLKTLQIDKKQFLKLAFPPVKLAKNQMRLGITLNETSNLCGAALSHMGPNQVYLTEKYFVQVDCHSSSNYTVSMISYAKVRDPQRTATARSREELIAQFVPMTKTEAKELLQKQTDNGEFSWTNAGENCWKRSDGAMAILQVTSLTIATAEAWPSLHFQK
jgi:hypothetical protein